jgi:dTDP-4-amino-4,6-dideoxygalactose transaminase
MGDGGMVVTNNKKIYNWMLKYRNHGMINRDHIDFWGLNMRLQPLQAIVAIEGLKKIDKVIKQRNKNAEKLDNELKKLSPHIILPYRIKGYYETFALYMILVERRDKLLKYLHKKRVEAKVHYPVPLNKQKASKIYNYDQNDFLIANQQAKKLITLPVHQYLTSNQLDYMIRCITNFYQKKIN